jgi:coenzyme F420-reducing hydrogenase delta subunit/Pyruvate/2-oxoacid:ferredoxin oxidoreductase delta subunit
MPPAPNATASPAAVPRVDPPVRGERLLTPFDGVTQRLEGTFDRFLGPAWNPLTQTGAIATVMFVIAVVTGVVVLIWYTPSVTGAWASVDQMGHSPWLAGLTRSLHRYSSDACVLFTLVHALRIFASRRFTGPRWLAWVTGIATTGLVGLTGWTGYWLVWDERARQVALGTARVLDTLPVFIDPLSRAFLVDERVGSLLFFIVFFVHMLLPLPIVLGLWLHLTRVSRPRFLTKLPMTSWLVASLVVVSLVVPATSAAPARMAVPPVSFTMDWWYLWPLWLSDRLSGAVLWALMFVTGAVLFCVPWALARGRARVAAVDVARCNACRTCSLDCPYEAIRMVPRTDGSTRYDVQAQVDPARCVGCGICAGSCDSAGIGLPWMPVPAERRRIDAWLAATLSAGNAPMLALVCAESAGGRLTLDAQTGDCAQLPGWRVRAVPCAGWVHSLSVERALRRGARGVLVVTCPPDACRHREGARWTCQRLSGGRKPALDVTKVDPSRVAVLALDATRTRALVTEASDFRRRVRHNVNALIVPPVGTLRRALVAATLVLALAGLTLLPADLVYRSTGGGPPALIVSFKHPGRLHEDCRVLTDAEKAALPPHMRRDEVCDRRRASVRLRVHVDGTLVLSRSFAPRGLWSDGNSIAVEEVPVEAGRRDVTVAVGDSWDPDEWTYADARPVNVVEGERRVILFDRLTGFSWH